MNTKPFESLPAEANSSFRNELVIGIENSGSNESVIDFASQLKCESTHYTLVHAIESAFPEVSMPSSETNPSFIEWRSEQEKNGWSALYKASEGLAVSSEELDHRLTFGEPAKELMQVSEEVGANLIVVGHNRRNSMTDFLCGSVARRLIHRCSGNVLVVRWPNVHRSAETAVFASDGSPESERCLSAFLRLSPQGLRRIYVLTVNEIDSGAAAMLVRGLPHLQHKAEVWIENGLREDAEAICIRLRGAGFEAIPLVVEGSDVARGISKACDTVGASLVVVASPPHGVWDRLVRGSVSEDLMENDSRSLLVLRP